MPQAPDTSASIFDAPPKPRFRNLGRFDIESDVKVSENSFSQRAHSNTTRQHRGTAEAAGTTVGARTFYDLTGPADV